MTHTYEPSEPMEPTEEVLFWLSFGYEPQAMVIYPESVKGMTSHE